MRSRNSALAMTPCSSKAPRTKRWLLVAFIIAVGALRLLLDAGSILLERAPAHLIAADVVAFAKTNAVVVDVAGFHAWELDSGEAVATLVLVTNTSELATLARAADALRAALHDQFHIEHATIEWRPASNARDCCAPPSEAAA